MAKISSLCIPFTLQTEGFSLSADCTTLTLDHGFPKTRNTSSQVDPAANLTFDLHLSAKERTARSHVVLPYTSAQEEEGLVGVAAHTSSGRIFYDPNEDCFEDSDPDDDLDF